MVDQSNGPWNVNFESSSKKNSDFFFFHLHRGLDPIVSCIFQFLGKAELKFLFFGEVYLLQQFAIYEATRLMMIPAVSGMSIYKRKASFL